MLVPLLLLVAAATQQVPGSVPGASIIDRNRADRVERPSTKRVAPPRRIAPRVTTDGATTPITGIRFQGAKAPPRVAKAARRFLGQIAGGVVVIGLTEGRTACSAPAS